MNGLVIGKFYPPHNGHHYLIDTALRECNKVYVAVCYSDRESISVENRMEWLKDRHPTAEVFKVLDNTPVEYSERSYRAFLGSLVPALFHQCWHGRYSLSDRYDPFPDVLYSGEEYAPDLARRITDMANAEKGNRWIFVPNKIEVRKLDRSLLPISATKFRDNPIDHWSELAPATRAGMCKRVVICGAESSGTTTLAEGLRDHYKTVMVPEYGRHFDAAVGRHHDWTSDDFLHIAREQKRWEDNLARLTSSGLLICDTDEFATAMFSTLYLEGDAEATAVEIMKQANATPADLYIVTSHESVHAEDDGLRVNLDKREWMTDWFWDNLPEHAPFVLMAGSKSGRLRQSVSQIDALLGDSFKFNDPIEYDPGYAEEYVWES